MVTETNPKTIIDIKYKISCRLRQVRYHKQKYTQYMQEIQVLKDQTIKNKK